jgi:Cys-tRNA(Pro)/Cys-tRNA(Cys) deacylase
VECDRAWHEDATFCLPAQYGTNLAGSPEVRQVAGSSDVSGGATPATAILDRAGIGYRLHPYRHDPRARSYGEEAAAALDVPQRRIFKTLIAAVDGRLVCAVVPVAGTLNLKALAASAGGKRAELADEAQAQRATGYVIGGISPLGHRTAMPVVLDSSVESFPTVYVSAGKRGLQLELAPADLRALTRATTAKIALISE